LRFTPVRLLDTASDIARHAAAVVRDRQEGVAVLAPARDDDMAGAGVDAVLDELGDRFQRIVLRQCNDGDGVPIVADAQLPAGTGAIGWSTPSRGRFHGRAFTHGKTTVTNCRARVCGLEFAARPGAQCLDRALLLEPCR
jgi:hypothetical protein